MGRLYSGIIIFVSINCFGENLCEKGILDSFSKSVTDFNQINPNCPSGVFVPKGTNNRWILDWSDEFDKPGLPDPQKWKFETKGNDLAWGNNEAQFYTDARIDNAKVANGKLTIFARKEDYQGRHFTSARLNSKKSLTYGRVEVRAKLPKGKGTWAAGWLLADKTIYGKELWPANGEIDFIEAVGHKPNFNHVSIHSLQNNFQNQTQITGSVEVEKGIEEFHTYALEWFPEVIRFYVDGNLIKSIEKPKDADWRIWPYNHDMHLILNLAVGGVWGNEQGIDPNAFPATFEIDSVRIYRPEGSQKECQVNSKN